MACDLISFQILSVSTVEQFWYPFKGGGLGNDILGVLLHHILAPLFSVCIRSGGTDYNLYYAEEITIGLMQDIEF